MNPHGISQPDEDALRALVEAFNEGTERATRENRGRPIRDRFKDAAVKSWNDEVER